jgi:hypothetical protein
MRRSFSAFTLVVFLCACLGQPASQPDAKKAEDACAAACRTALESKQDLSSGPCLSEKLMNDWVCDVAHSPRTAADNQPENQCQAFRKGEAHHFTEVDTECRVIRTY